MPTSKVHPGRSVALAAKAFTSTKVSARKPDKLDERQLATWIEQAASIPGWNGGSPRSGGIPL